MAKPDFYEFILEVKGHYAIDTRPEDKNLLVYVERNTTHKTVIPHEAIKDMVEQQNIPSTEALRRAFLAGINNSVKAGDVVSVGGNDAGAVETIADLYGVGTNDLTELELREDLNLDLGVAVKDLPNTTDFGMNNVNTTVTDKDGNVKQDTDGTNLRTNAGRDWQSDVMGTLGAQPAASKYIGVTANSDAPAAGDTTLTGEVSSGTLTRAIYTAYNHTAGTATYNQTKTFTSDQTIVLAKAGEFFASSGGSQVFSTLISPTASVISGDTVAFTWTKNI